MRLQGRISIVTGAGRGIGRAIAHAFAREGARVALVDKDGEAVQEAASQVAAVDEARLAVECDVSHPHSVDGMARRVLERWGRIDILVNNAGIGGPFHRIDEVSVEEWEAILGTNLKGPFLCCRRILPEMARNGFGKVINIASVQGLIGASRSAAYIASKAGLIGFTRAIAVEWAEAGILANAICPGYVDTRLGIQPEAVPGHLEQVLGMSLIKRIARPEEVAHLAVYLASPDADYMTGSVLVLDGGITAH